ncbi:hypothetical protein Bpfe_019683 [Biomphalaria pfeifferi]|uniref:Uncharacterized protein n=1 Tax=Biomphalaria pfeifferi TaxID=112525 RepID=A0AAD8F417_BIOPF|nr:hypothetical protein Bpfe_019683 [Biomphalaria pfeifferi]
MSWPLRSAADDSLDLRAHCDFCFVDCGSDFRAVRDGLVDKSGRKDKSAFPAAFVKSLIVRHGQASTLSLSTGHRSRRFTAHFCFQT